MNWKDSELKKIYEAKEAEDKEKEKAKKEAAKQAYDMIMSLPATESESRRVWTSIGIGMNMLPFLTGK